jgi:alpha-methylacyl-CoA racemase
MLAGYVLLDFSSIGPGPRCTRLLADYGMTVVKIRPPAGATKLLEAPWFSYSANRGIPQLRVNLKKEAGQELVRRLACQADALVESFRPGTAARLGLGYDQMADVNPAIIYCSISGYGQQGPQASWPAHDLNWLAAGGLLHASARRDDGAPAIPGGAVADSAGAHSAAVAILAGLLRRSATGHGAYLDVAVTDSVLRMLSSDLDAYLAGESPIPRASATMPIHSHAWYGVYQSADGKWLALAAVEPQFWAELCRKLGLDQFIAAHDDPARQDELRLALRSAFADAPRAHWITELGPLACVAPVNDPVEVLADPQLTSRPLVMDVRVGDRTVQQMTPRLPLPDPPRLGSQQAGESSPQQAAAVLRSFGLSDIEISGLRGEGVLT